MPLHDWSAFGDGDFHSFHVAWTTTLMAALNNGVLPLGLSARAEQRTGVTIAGGTFEPDVEVSISGPAARREAWHAGTLEAAVARPVADLRRTAPAAGQRQRRIRVQSDDGETVAIIELVSRANKSRHASALNFAEKCVRFIDAGVGVTVIDVLPNGADLLAAIEDRLGLEPSAETDGLFCLSVDATESSTLYTNGLRVGADLPDVALFLGESRYVRLPLAETYGGAVSAQPATMRDRLAGTITGPA